MVPDLAEATRGETRRRRVPLISLDVALAEERFAIEPATLDDPESIYERAWAVSVIELALERLSDEQARAGRGAIFDKLRPALAGAPTATFAELAAELNSTEGAMRVVLRQRLR